MILRPYQEDAVSAGVAFFRSPKQENAICVEPTGSGKSVIIASIVQRLNEPTLIFQPSVEILEQNMEKLRSYGFTPSVFSDSAGSKQVGEITLATIGSVAKHPHLFQGIRHVIVDECHYVSPKESLYADFFKALGAIKILGFTATPYRLVSDGFGSILKFLTRTRPRVFQRVIHHVQNKHLFDAGFLCPLDYVKKHFPKDKLRVNSTGAEYTDESIQLLFQGLGFESLLANEVSSVLQSCKNSLVFTKFVSEARHLSATVPGCSVVTAETPKNERSDIVRGFRSGKIRCVANVGVFTVGFDFPELESVVLARPTLSLGKYYQMVGRVVRPNPNKPKAAVHDLVGLSDSFGRVEDLRLDENGGKWALFSGSKQLTNIYQGENSERTFQPRSEGQFGLNWSGPVEFKGVPVLRARPTGLFWNAWRDNKDAVKKSGLSVSRTKSGFVVQKAA